MNKNLKGLLFVATIVILLTSISAISASDIDNNQTSVIKDTQSTTSQVSDVVTTKEVASDNSDNTIETSTKKEVTKTSIDDKQSTKSKVADKEVTTKESKKSLKTAQTHIVNSSTVHEYFGDNSTNFTLTDKVNDGDTLDIQGTINLTNTSLVINKPVNIISSTHDSKICLNTVAGTLFGENPGSSFAINRGGSYSNITGINFYNTQLWISNTTHVTFDNISAIVENARVGSGNGQTSIRNNASYITLKNSYISTENNGGSSSFVIAWANYCTIDNCTIVGIGNVGNLLYLTTYNVNIPSDVTLVNSYNNITNNRLIGPSQVASICYSIAVTGEYNLIENNTIDYNGSGIVAQWGFGKIINGNHTIRNNVINGGTSSGIVVFPDSIAENNTITGALSLSANAVAINNTANSIGSMSAGSVAKNNIIKGSVTAGYANVTIINNTIGGVVTLNTNARNSVFANNTMNGTLEVKTSNALIENNTIDNYKSYTISITGSSNTVKDNVLIATTRGGDDTIVTKTTNTISGNTPVTESYVVTNTNYSTYFDDNGFIRTDVVANYSTLVLSGEITDKKFVIDNSKVTIISENADTILKGVSINVTKTGLATISNITINNTGYSIPNTIVLESNYNVVEYSRIYYNTTNNLTAIKVIGNNTQIRYNNITIAGPSGYIDGNPYIAPTIALAIHSNNNNISRNNITTYASTDNTYGTVESITIQSLTNDGIIIGNLVDNNVINTSGTGYVYAINTNANTNNNTFSNNKITTTSSNAAYGFNMLESEKNIINRNTITVNGTTLAYGMALGSWNNGVFNHTNIDTNTITGQANQVYLIEVYGDAFNTTIKSNKLTGYGDYVMGIGVNSNNTVIRSNTITLTGTSNGTTTSYDVIKPTTAGIVVQNGKNITVYSNTNMKVTNGYGIKLINVTNTSVYSNTITSNNTAGISLNNINDSNITQNTITTDVTGITLYNSTNNTITKNNVNGKDTYAITLDLSNNNFVENNTLYAQEYTGNVAVSAINSTDNSIFGNGPTTIVLTNDNFFTYFDDNYVLKDEYVSGSTVITLGSNIYNKNMTITCNATVNNPDKYVIYNGTIICADSYNNATSKGIVLNNIIINSTDARESLIIINSKYVTINYANLYQYNPFTISHTLKVNTNASLKPIKYSNITLYGAEILTSDDTPSLVGLYDAGNLEYIEDQYLNIYVEAITSDKLGKSAGIYGARTTGSSYYIKNSNITVIGDNIVYGTALNVLMLQYNNINVTSNNIGYGVYYYEENNNAGGLYYSNVTVNAKNNAIGFYMADSSKKNPAQNSKFYITSDDQASAVVLNNVRRDGQYIFNGNTIYIDAKDITAFDITNTSTDISSNNLYLQGEYVKAINYKNTAYQTTTINNNKIFIEANATDSTQSPIILNNVTMYTVTGNTISVIDQANPSVAINITDSNQINVTKNYIQMNKFQGDAAAISSNSENITIENNTPTTSYNSLIRVNDTMTIGKDNTLIVNVTDYGGNALTGNVTIKIGNDVTVATLENGVASITYKPVTSDDVTIDVVFESDNANYPSTTLSKDIKVLKLDSIITVVDVEDAYVDDDLTITGKLSLTDNTPITDATIIININDQIITTTTDSTGSYTATGITSKDGNYYVVVTYDGDANNTNARNTTSYIVTKYSTTITVNAINNTKVNETATIVATITDANGNPVTNGKVVFKANGVTLKDAEGNPIYVQVVNGTATLKYVFDYKPNTYNITAVYSGSYKYVESRTTENTPIIIEGRTPTVTLLTDKTQLKAGQTVKFVVQVRDGNKVVKSGEVVFKINGITIKDANGNPIKVKVVNGIATLEYTIPEGYSARNYNITVVFGDKYYTRGEANTTITVQKTNKYIQANVLNMTNTGNTTIQINLYDENNQIINYPTKVTVKINGITQISAITVINGTATLNIQMPQKQGVQNITIIAGENNAYKAATTTLNYYKQATYHSNTNSTVVKTE